MKKNIEPSGKELLLKRIQLSYEGHLLRFELSNRSEDKKESNCLRDLFEELSSSKCPLQCSIKKTKDGIIIFVSDRNESSEQGMIMRETAETIGGVSAAHNPDAPEAIERRRNLIAFLNAGYSKESEEVLADIAKSLPKSVTTSE